MKLDENEIRNVGKRFRNACKRLAELSKKYGGYSEIPIDCEEVKEYLQADEEYNKIMKMIDNIRGPDPQIAKLQAFRLYDILEGVNEQEGE